MTPFHVGSRLDTRFFPIPSLLSPASSTSASRRIRLRVSRRFHLFRLANDVIRALNALYFSVLFSKSFCGFFSPSAFHRRSHIFILSSVRRFLSRRPQRLCDEELGSLRSLFADFLSTQSYHSHLNAAVPLVASRVALPSSPPTVSLLSVLDDEAASWLADPANVILGSAPCVSSRPRSFFGASQSEYQALVLRLHSLNLVSFTSTPFSVNGLFTIPKPDGELRLIIDARPTNACHSLPLAPLLPDPSLLSQLFCDESAPVFVAKVDIKSFYNCLLLPEYLLPWFALPAVDASLVGLDPSEAPLVFPCFRAVPMGWAHSVWLAQRAHRHILYRFSCLRPVDELRSGNDFLLDRLRHFVYIDDVGFLGPDLSECERALLSVEAAYSAVGLVSHPSKRRLPSSSPCELMGVEVDGSAGVVGVSPLRIRRLCDASLFLISRRWSTGREMQVLLGHWAWLLLLRRPAFSIFSSAYRFARVFKNGSGTLWPSVVSELRLAVAVAPLLFVDLRAPFSPRVVAVDASVAGLGVSFATVPVADVAALAGAPFPSGSYVQLDPRPSAAVRVPLGSALRRRVPLWAVEWSLIGGVSAVVRTQPGVRFVPVPSALPPSVSSACWSTAISAQWALPAHINALECHSAATAVRWLLSFPTTVRKRFVLLSDSRVAVGCLSKGRSSSYALLRVSRKFAALVLSSGLSVSFRWIRSEMNPADGPSRAL